MFSITVEELIGRYIIAPDNYIGQIVTAEEKINEICEVCVNFEDGIRYLDTNFTKEMWMKNSFPDKKSLIGINYAK